MLAILLQAVLPGAMAAADPKGLDVSRFICAPSGELTPETRAAAERIARLLGEHSPAEPQSDGHCPLCTLAHDMPLAEPAAIAAPFIFSHKQVLLRFEPGLVRRAQGSPLGSRGPPSHI